MSVAIRFIVLPSHAPRVRMCSHWTGWHDHTHETQSAGGVAACTSTDVCSAMNSLRSAEHFWTSTPMSAFHILWL